MYPAHPPCVSTPQELIPRRAVMAGMALLALTLAGVAAVRVAGVDIRQPDARTVAMRELRFVDQMDGSIAVIDAASQTELDVMRGEQGFLRGTLRGLVRERKRRGLSAETPLQLMARADGRMTLADPTTGERLDLESFGPSNLAVYARWLEQPASRKDTP